MLLGFAYLYKFVMFFFCFFQKAENNRLKKNSWPKFCNIFLFLIKIGSVGLVDQQMPLVSSYEKKVVFIFARKTNISMRKMFTFSHVLR